MAVRSRRNVPERVSIDPFEVLDWYNGPEVPDPITFVIGEKWLNKPYLYPRQATFLKILFLRTDIMTGYDHEVIAEWIQMFRDTNPEDENREDQFDAKTLGIQPDIYERMAWCQERGYKWFRELILAIGRRGSKGYVCALAMAYVLWHYMCVAGETEVLTWDGIKRIEDLAGTTARLMDADGKWVDAPIRQFGVQKLYAVNLMNSGRQKTIYATAQHRWFVQPNIDLNAAPLQEIRTIDLVPGQQLRVITPHNCVKQGSGIRPSTFGIAHGIVYGDGTEYRSESHGTCCITLYGSKNIDLIRFFNGSFHSEIELDERYSEDKAIRVTDLPRFFKRLPDRDEAPSYLYGWLAGYFAADGCFYIQS